MKEKCNMRLYAFQPNGFGELSFYVCSDNEENAKKAVYKHIEEHKEKEENEDYSRNDILYGGYEKFGTKLYKTIVLEPNCVIINNNE